MSVGVVAFVPSLRPLPERFECRPKLVVEFGEAIGALGGLEKHPSVDEVRNLVAKTLDEMSSVHRLSSRKPGSRIVFLASAVAARTAHGALPTVAEFATAVVAACVDAIERSGHVVYVGGADYLEQ
ncbi:hypothetical protein [Rhodococcoides yunnanense]|uniref:Uncharacterized protein n=1 Tax=Rhodococcoides yunnanense TaxID=278209 RepID=A0ABU4BGM3_9NOCA|nr:hypothetical protein [Rhodococcus yunnanensis]MDV6263340.1 hypothetical protein [Rhodococcus yunnanensis]